MSGPPVIEFWFDFSSSYAYFAALEIEAIADRHGRAVLWRPFMLGAAFEVTGARGLSRTPMKKEYARRDWARISRLRGVPYGLPPHHPSVALPAVRAFYFIEREFPATAASFARAVLEAYFREGVDTAKAATITRLAGAVGLPAERVGAAIEDPSIKALARQRSEEAIDRGVFGSPWMFVDEEPFWGWDRLPMVERWLKTGGW